MGVPSEGVYWGFLRLPFAFALCSPFALCTR